MCAAGSSVKSGGVGVEVEGEAGPVIRFESSDFAVCGHVSIGLAGRVRKIVAFFFVVVVCVVLTFMIHLLCYM